MHITASSTVTAIITTSIESTCKDEDESIETKFQKVYKHTGYQKIYQQCHSNC